MGRTKKAKVTVDIAEMLAGITLNKHSFQHAVGNSCTTQIAKAHCKKVRKGWGVPIRDVLHDQREDGHEEIARRAGAQNGAVSEKI